MTENIFTDDCKFTPYWWDQVDKVNERALADAQLPPTVDVVVIGSGYTGLHAALQTARGGRHSLVLDAESAGWGCSTRNGGQISTSVKPDFDTLSRRHGEAAASAILREGRDRSHSSATSCAPRTSTAFDGITFQTRPFYRGNPWFLAPSVAYYRWRDRQGR